MDRMSNLPTIKCSSCAVDIDILHLADHVCVKPTSPSEPSVPAPASPTSSVSTRPTMSPVRNRAPTFGTPSFSNRHDRAMPRGRVPTLAQIDPQTANKPFHSREPSPSRSNQPWQHSPMPTNSHPPKPHFQATRSATTPLPRSMAPLSPDLHSNLDCAFPPFPKKNATPHRSKSRTQDHYLEPGAQYGYAAPSLYFAPLSPRTNAGETIARRMDTILPGPFDRRPSATNGPMSPATDRPLRGHARSNTQDSIMSSRSERHQRNFSVATSTRSSSYSNHSTVFTSSPHRGRNRVASPAFSVTSGQTEGELGIDAFLQTLQGGKASSIHARKQRYPDAGSQQSERDRREPPARPPRPSEKDLPSSDMSDPNTRNSTARSNNMLHSRSASSNGSEIAVPNDTVSAPALRLPPLLTSRIAAETSLNSLHSASDSGLSDDSYTSSGFRSAASSRSSPPGSVVGQSRQAFKSSHTDHNADDNIPMATSPESYGEVKPLRGAGIYMRLDPPSTVPRSLSPGYPNPPESPMDPAIQRGAFMRRPTELGPPIDPDTTAGAAQSPTESPELQSAETRRPKTASKGNCRGCAKPIIGKSVKDSSGRLTGRYHKQCFSCRTCADPFPTAEFYVFENSPYCEQHYHKLNGSLCGSCDRGIEGEYLETDTRQKYHPRCFTCTTCRVVLRDGYFDVNGSRYCERHAQSAAAPPRDTLGLGSYKPRNLQKRGTRLMMMA